MRAHESHWCARLQPSRRLEWPRVQTAEFRRADLGHIAWSCAFLVVRLAILQGCRYSSPVPPSPAARLPAKARWWGLLVLGRTTPTIYLGLSYFDLQSRLVLATRSGDIAVRQQLPERQSQNDQHQAAFRISARRGLYRASMAPALSIGVSIQTTSQSLLLKSLSALGSGPLLRQGWCYRPYERTFPVRLEALDERPRRVGGRGICQSTPTSMYQMALERARLLGAS